MAKKKAVKRAVKAKRTSGLSVASMILGIVGVLFAWVPPIGWLLNLLAIIFGAVSLNQIKEQNLLGKGYAWTGVILGIIGLVVWLIVIALVIMFFSSGTMMGFY